MKLRLLTLLCVLAVGLHAEAVKRYVTLDGTRLLSKPTAFAKSYGTLKMNTVVLAEAPKNGYVKVRVQGDTDNLKQATGYLSTRAIQENKSKMGYSKKAASSASAEEVAAATKGFNKQVEAQYKADNAALDYDLVTKLEERTKVEEPRSGLEGFREKGKLGEFAEGSKGGENE